jgi:hypothetical protein
MKVRCGYGNTPQKTVIARSVIAKGKYVGKRLQTRASSKGIAR